MKKSVTLLFVLCFLFSCRSSWDGNAEHVYAINIDEAQKNEFYSIFDSVAYIPLETMEDLEIGKINRILYLNEKYIVWDGLTNMVFIFNDDGTYYSKIDAIGNGPGEYAQIIDIAINKYDGTIKILDAMQKKIVTFDKEGQFVGETKLPVSPTPQHFCQVNREKYAFDFQRCSYEKEWQYNVSVNSEDFTGEINKYFPYDKPLSICFSSRVTLQDVNGEILCLPLYSPTVYTIDSLEMKPRYSFDFGGKWVSQDFIDTEWKDALEFMNKLNDANFVHYFHLLESGSHIYAEFIYGENKYHLVLDKETDHLYLQQESEAYKCHYSEIPMCCVGNKFVIPLTPLEYNSMVTENTVQLPEDNNPVLMFATFKNF